MSLLFVGDIVGSALRRAERILREHRVEIDIPPDLPMVRLDPALFEQVLFNLLDNAAKYAPESSTVSIDGAIDGDALVLRLTDEGPGIPDENLERVFDSFHRVRKADHVRAGTGLGLSICRGFVEAMGGSIVAGNRRDRTGAVFTVRMPSRPTRKTWTP